MNHILTDLSDAVLVDAIRLNMCDFFRYLGGCLPGTQFENGKFTRWHTPLPHPWFNGVLSSRAFEEQDEDFIAATIQYFRAKKVGTFTWWMEPPLRPADWELALSKHGFGFSNGTPGMAADFHTLDESFGAVNGFEVRAVADEESLRTWVGVFIRGYGLPPTWASVTFDLWRQLGLDPPLRNYLGYWNGTPVSTSSLFYGGGAAGIYCVATLPEARGRGLGAALTLYPLLEARALGYRVGVLQSSEMGFNVYKRLGFRHLCQIENFHLSVQ